MGGRYRYNTLFTSSRCGVEKSKCSICSVANTIDGHSFSGINLDLPDARSCSKQGADRGTQYRSIIFYRTEEEKIQALKTIEEVQSAYDDMIVTEVKMFEHFYKAEANHQDYYNRNSEAGYCTAVINPKLDKLKKMYKDKLKR